MNAPTLQLAKVRVRRDAFWEEPVDAIYQRNGWAVIERPGQTGFFGVVLVRCGLLIERYADCDEAINLCRLLGDSHPFIFEDVDPDITPEKLSQREEAKGVFAVRNEWVRVREEKAASEC